MSACRFRIGERIEFSSLSNMRHVFHGELRQLLQKDLVVVRVDGEATDRVIQQVRLRKTVVNFVGNGDAA